MHAKLVDQCNSAMYAYNYVAVCMSPCGVCVLASLQAAGPDSVAAIYHTLMTSLL